MFRLSTASHHRKAGIASRMAARVEAIARELDCYELIADTSAAQYGAMHFYKKNGWTEVLYNPQFITHH